MFYVHSIEALEKRIHECSDRDSLNTGFGADILELPTMFPTGVFYPCYLKLFREFNRKLDSFGMAGLIPDDNYGAGFWPSDISEYFDPSEPVLDDEVDEFVYFGSAEVFYDTEQVTV